jgi:hypothetical protein
MNAFIPPALAAVVLILMVAAPGNGNGRYFSYAIGLVVVLILVAAAINFRRLEVTFDGRHVVLRYGVIRKKIAVREIVALEPAQIKWWRFGGTGIRMGGGMRGWVIALEPAQIKWWRFGGTGIRMGGGMRGWVTGSGPGVKIETTRGVTYANCERAERLVALVDEFKRAAEGQQT